MMIGGNSTGKPTITVVTGLTFTKYIEVNLGFYKC